MKRLSVAGKKYTKQDGTESTEWTNLGILNVNQNGREYILLDPKINLAGLPIGDNGMVMVGVFEETNQSQQPQQQMQQSPQTQYQDNSGRQVSQQQYNQNQNNYQPQNIQQAPQGTPIPVEHQTIPF